jgi:hypothetical protein
MSVLLAALLAGLGTGCETIQEHSLTCDLWSDDGGISHSRPQTDSGLALFYAKPQPEVLVEYNAVSDRHPAGQRRAYFLDASRRRLTAGRPPRFVGPKRDHGLQPISILPTIAMATNSLSTNLCCAVAKGNSFILYRADFPPEYCTLPYYQDGTFNGNWKRVLLTPLTVTVDMVVDVTVVGVVAAIFAGYAYVAGGGH